MTDDRIQELRTNTFIAMFFLGMVLVLGAEIVDWPDMCLLHYGLSSGLCWICAAFFTDWWRYKGNATAIYGWITILLYAIALNDSLQFYARWLLVYRPEQYQDFLTTVVWEYRSAPKVICLAYLVSFTIWQRYSGDMRWPKK